MKYIVTHNCGHDEEVVLYGPGKERDRRIAQMESQECPECRALHASERDEAKGYATLDGSPKQVSWASDIREDIFSQVSRYLYGCIREVEAAVASGEITRERASEGYDDVDLTVLAILDGLRSETSARWLIDNRSISVQALADHYDPIAA